MKKVSVIIPMYNSEKYIGQCLSSVLAQNFQDMEVLVIDDGSSDQGSEICEEAARTDARVCLRRQENEGVSSARNHGIESAKGEYVFFLDSDDAIHPFLIEKMLLLAEEQQADLVFCSYHKLGTEKIETILAENPKKYERFRWQTAKGEEAEDWFHRKYMNDLSGIGGKLIRRSAIGSLRFDEKLSNGEDTLFLYHIIRQGIRSVFLQKGWYYYRIHGESVTHSQAMVKGKQYFESSMRIRDEEYRRGRHDFALGWEQLVAVQTEKNYRMLQSAGDQKGCRILRRTAAEERRHPMFGRLLFSEKLLFELCFSCYPVYALVSRYVPVLLAWKESFMMRKEHADIGIITFHCSNNFGAMLQAYGLKTFLRKNGKKAEIVRYEPVFMTGRHWWIPYSPIRGLKGRLWGIFNMWDGLASHLWNREEFSRKLKNMNYFRFKYLVDKKQRKLYSCGGLKGLKYRCYVVGSDQIWNPDITCGLRRAYFGAFSNPRKKKVISYAASFGSSGLSGRDDGKFAKLIRHVDAVSVREESAIPYVTRICGREVTAVLDPVFFLKKESWQRIERIPKYAEKERYILVYVTEPNRTMSEYAKKLSAETGLSVIEVHAQRPGIDMGFEVDRTAGPSEFLGYIHKAEYVVSNSFHAAAFSIIYEKQFLAFVHSNLGARIRNILQIHGLEDRLCVEEAGDIYARIDWESVRQKTKENIRASGGFLLKNLQE